jgi:16S rRNA (cytosine967-C5)-methyltransferase
MPPRARFYSSVFRDSLISRKLQSGGAIKPLPKIQSEKSGVSAARAAAFDILLRVEREDSYASELLHASAYENLSTRDHALATELVMGVLRWRSGLDDEIAALSSLPLAKLDLEILVALRLALYQFRYLDRVPKRAALHESVELVKRARKRSAAPFVNAVLRKLAAVVPAAESSQARLSSTSEDSANDLAREFAHPLWLVERWAREFGAPAARAICEYDQTIPQTAIRLRAADAAAQLAQEGITLSAGKLLASARRVEAGEITQAQAFRSGTIVIQDEASQLVAALTGRDAGAGARILDCCAAPGGKTLAMADRNPEAAITAVEVHAHRARLLRKLVGAAQSTASIEIVVADARSLPTMTGFDCVLADVPCSGTGTLARNPEIKWRLRAADLQDLHARQVAILRSALAQAAPGGRVIYSTCSLEREENEDVVAAVLAEENAEKRSFRAIDCRVELDRLRATGELVWGDLDSLVRGPHLRTIPGVHPCDGFFAAVLEKTFATDLHGSSRITSLGRISCSKNRGGPFRG